MVAPLRALILLAVSAVVAALVSLGLIMLSVERGWFPEASGGREVVEIPWMVEPTQILNPAIPIIIIDGDYRVYYDPINPEATLPVIILTVTPQSGALAANAGSAPAAQQGVTVSAPVDFAVEGYATALPTGCTLHTVSFGETLSFIAQRWGVDLGMLLDINDMTENDARSLQPGDRLIIPWASCVAALYQQREGGGAEDAIALATVAPAQLAIETVRGAGDLEIEEAVIRNRGATSVDLAGWSLSDGAGHEFTFGSQRLFAGAELRVATREGTNLPTQLFWGLAAPVWHPGVRVTLKTPDDVSQFTFTVP